MIVNAGNLNTLYVSYNAAFANAFAGAKPDYEQVATVVPSTSESEMYAWMGQFPQLREWLGDRVVKNIVANGYTVPNKDFESTVAVPRNKIEDDKYGIFTPMFQQMGYASAMHPDSIVFALLAAGAAAGSLGYDKVPFFSASHPIITAGVPGTKSNYDSTTGTNSNLWCIMDVSRPIKPLLFQKREDYKFTSFTSLDDIHVFLRKEYLFGISARVAAAYGLWQAAYGSLNNLDATNVQSYYQSMAALKADDGQPLGIKPGLCVVGPSRWAEARAVFETPTLSGGATNPNYGLMKVLVSPFLT